MQSCYKVDTYPPGFARNPKPLCFLYAVLLYNNSKAVKKILF